jgi:hypothetical protein
MASPNAPKPKKPKAYTGKELTNHLRTLAATLHDVVYEDNPETGMSETRARTKGQALGEEIFKLATGWWETKIDDEDQERKIWHKPEPWAIAMVFDRMEGKAPQAINETDSKVKAKDKVAQLAKDRLNSLVPTRMGPPSLRKKDAE